MCVCEGGRCACVKEEVCVREGGVCACVKEGGVRV